MLRLENDIMMVDLPQGHTMQELTEMCRNEIKGIIDAGMTYGKDIKINGRLTTSMALLMGHELAHVCRSVSLFDPKEGVYIPVITH